MSRILLLLAGDLVGCSGASKPADTASLADTGADATVDSGWHPTVEPEWFPNADGVTTTDTSVTDTSGTPEVVQEGCGAEGETDGAISDSTTYDWLPSDGAAMGGVWDPSTLDVPLAPTEDRSLWAWTGRVPVAWPEGIERMEQEAELNYHPPLPRRALMPTSHRWDYEWVPRPRELIPVPTSDGIQYRVARIEDEYYGSYHEANLTMGEPNAQIDVDGDGLADVLYGSTRYGTTWRPVMKWSSGPWFGLRGSPAMTIERRCGGTFGRERDFIQFPMFATPIRGGDMDGDGIDDIAGGYLHIIGSEVGYQHATVSPFVYSMAGFRTEGFGGTQSAELVRLPPVPSYYEHPWDHVDWAWGYTWKTPMVTRDVDGDGLAEIAVNGSFFMPDLATGTMDEVPILNDTEGMPFVDPVEADEAPVFRPLEEDWNGDGYDDWAILFSDAYARWRAGAVMSFYIVSGAPRRDDGAIHLSDAWATVEGDMIIHMASVMPHWWTRPDGNAPDVASQPGFVVSSYGVARIFTPSNLPAGSWDMDDVALTLFDGPTLETSGYADAPPWIGGRAVVDDLDEDGRADVVFGATAADSSYEMRVLYGRTLFEAGAL